MHLIESEIMSELKKLDQGRSSSGYTGSETAADVRVSVMLITELITFDELNKPLCYELCN